LLSQEICLALSVRISPALGSLHITGPYITTYAATACSNGAAVAGTKQVFAIPQSVITYLGANNTINNLITLANQGLGATLPNNGSFTYRYCPMHVNAIVQAFEHCRIFIGFSNTSQGLRVENANATLLMQTTCLFIQSNFSPNNHFFCCLRGK